MSGPGWQCSLQMLVLESLIPAPEVLCLLYFEVKKQRLEQIIFQKIAQPTLREVLTFDDRTQRDTGAFGSSDKSVEKSIIAF